GSPPRSSAPKNSTSSTSRSGAADRRAVARLRAGGAPRDLLVRHGRRHGARALGVLPVGLHDALYELVPDDVLAAEAHELDALDRLEHIADDDQARLLLARKVHLRDVARDHHPRAKPETGEEHLHLLGAGVLGLV